jgi:hypothetical protein
VTALNLARGKMNENAVGENDECKRTLQTLVFLEGYVTTLELVPVLTR